MLLGATPSASQAESRSTPAERQLVLAVGQDQEAQVRIVLGLHQQQPVGSLAQRQQREPGRRRKAGQTLRKRDPGAPERLRVDHAAPAGSVAASKLWPDCLLIPISAALLHRASA